VTNTATLSTTGCSFPLLQNFTQTATGIQTTGQMSLLYANGNSAVIQIGSYVAFSCLSNYTNTGGSLNVTCNTNGSWSQFPNCVLNPGIYSCFPTFKFSYIVFFQSDHYWMFVSSIAKLHSNCNWYTNYWSEFFAVR
jgi:hypothetical protein